MNHLVTGHVERLSKLILYTRGARLPLARFCGPESSLHWIGKTAAWIHEHSPARQVHASRFDLYDAVARIIAKPALTIPILYLEFGVASGTSLSHWVRNDNHPESLFVGYDTFEGLPEDWGRIPKGAYTMNGKMPAISDPRVKFNKGLFEDTTAPRSHRVPTMNRLPWRASTLASTG